MLISYIPTPKLKNIEKAKYLYKCFCLFMLHVYHPTAEKPEGVVLGISSRPFLLIQFTHGQCFFYQF